LIYAYEEGRGVGLVNKFRSIHLEQKIGLNTAESFKTLGFPKEPRDFKGHILALRSVFTGSDIKILSKNPEKLSAIQNAGINIVEDVQLKFSMSELKKEYVRNKNKYLGHTNEIG
jgi:GTP cyclohydrolase II